MKAVAFDYVRPASVDEALRQLADDAGARVLAGGQTLIPMLAMRLARPTRLVDVARLSALSGIRATPTHVVIGAATTQAAAERDAVVVARLPLLAKALPWVGHAATRHRGTIGGSLANGDPAAEIPLVAVALESVIVARSAVQEFALPAGEFYLAPMTTALPAAALVLEVRFPVWGDGRVGAAFHEVGARASDFALVACAAQAALDSEGRCIALTAAVGGATDTPTRLAGLGEALRGSRLEEDRVRAAVAAATAGLDGVEDLHASAAYRKRVAATLARRAILDAKSEALGARHAR
jgi:CO/xanthine dehydrogenase FAD-binding subunit